MYSRSKVRSSVTPKEVPVNPFGLKFSLQAQATTVNERPSPNKQISDFRDQRDQQSYAYRSLSENTGVPLPGRRHSQPLYGTKDREEHEQSSASYSGAMEHRSAPRHRQVHHPATAYAAQLTDLTQPEVISHHSSISKAQGEDPFNSYAHATPRMVHSAGAVQPRHHKGIMHIPGDKVVIAESPGAPGIPVIYRSQEERSANPDRLNLDRKRLTMCPILEGEDHLRLLNFQHNSIRKIEHLTSLRRLIFLDLYDNQLEEITGLGALKSLRVLMLGKNRIRKIENLHALSKLDVLDLHGNQIDRIENLCHLEELRVLNLAGNRITHVNGLAGLEALTELNLRRNKVITVVDMDNLPSLQRLFLSFNCITSYEDICCLADAQSLSEISLDGNPLAQDINYKSIILKNIHRIRQLDMKKVTEEERQISSTVAKREEERKRETNKLVALKEKHRIAIDNAARQWEATKCNDTAKMSHLQPHSHSMAREERLSSPDNMYSGPWSGDMETDQSQSMDQLENNSAELSCSSMSTFSKAPTPDLLANISSEVCHLAELDGDTLNLYGSGSMEALDKSWGIQAAGSITTISFKFIDFDEITNHLHKIRIRFPNVSTILFGDCNLNSLQQLNALTSLRHLDNITIANEGNQISTLFLWKPYLLFRLSHLDIKNINNEEVFLEDRQHAEGLFTPISHITTSQLPSSRLLELLGDHCRSNTQALSELELKGKKQLMADQKTTAGNVGKAGLQFFCEEAWQDLLQERLFQSTFTCNYVKELVSEAILINKKQRVLEKTWSQVFVQIIHGAVEKMFDPDKYRLTELKAFQKRK